MATYWQSLATPFHTLDDPAKLQDLYFKPEDIRALAGQNVGGGDAGSTWNTWKQMGWNAPIWDTQSALAANSNGGSNYRFVFDESGNPVAMEDKTSDKGGMRYEVYKDADGNFRLRNPTPVAMDTNWGTDNAALAAIAGGALGGAYMAGSGSSAPASGAAGGSSMYSLPAAGLSPTGAPAVTSLGVPASLGGDALLAGSSLSGALGGAGATGGLLGAGIPVTAGAGLSALQAGAAGGFSPAMGGGSGALGSLAGAPAGTGVPPPAGSPPPSVPPPAGAAASSPLVKSVADMLGISESAARLLITGAPALAGLLSDHGDQSVTQKTTVSPQQQAARDAISAAVAGRLPEGMARDRANSDRINQWASLAATVPQQFQTPQAVFGQAGMMGNYRPVRGLWG